MGKGDPCGVCGETRTRLVDGFYYCVECGTQDTNVQETVVEHQALADGTFAIARRSRYSVKIKEGVEMSPEWYKWHKYNFLLAGLTEQLIELGAAPSVRMKVLWIWSRYVKKFQKKEAMGPAQVLKQLEASSSSSEEEEEAEDFGPRSNRAKSLRVDRVTNYMVVAILALALNFDRSPILLSRFMRFLRWRLLPVADKFRFVPAEVLDKLRRKRARQLTAATYDTGSLTVFYFLPNMMYRVSKLLELGGPLTPDVDGVIYAQLRELRLPSALAALVRALMDVAPVSFELESQRKELLGGLPTGHFPDCETAVMAYIVVALKMCFGLDDDYERRLSDAVELINEEAEHPRAYSSRPSPTPTPRLFGFGAWAARLRLRGEAAASHCAPLAWARARRGRDDAAVEHFREFTSERRRGADNAIRKGAKARLTDQVTMEILDRIPKRYEVGVLSLEELKPAMASGEPQTAIVRAVGQLLPAERRKLLDEDFTQYSLEYAYRHLALPAPASRPHKQLFRGVQANEACGQRLGDAVYSSLADKTTVYVKNCSNRHWARTRRPAVAHVVDDSDVGYDSRVSKEEKVKFETFVEEDEGRNIFDDDFSDIPIKEEKADSKDDVNVDETKDNTNWADDIDNFESAGVEDDADERGMFDSDDEVEPQFNPETFNRKEVIREMMTAVYKNCHIEVPARFLALGEKQQKKKKKTYPSEAPVREYMYGIGTEYWAKKFKQQEATAKVEDLIATYNGKLPDDVLNQVEEQVRGFTNANESADVIEPASELADPSFHTDINAMEAQDVDESRDVELIENEAKNNKSNDEDSCEEHAYDPVLKSDANFDEKTHDVEQLYVKLKELPPPESERPASPAPDDDLTAIIDESIRQMKGPKKKNKERMIIKTDIDHLVDDPKRITRFNYWFTILCKRTKSLRRFTGPYQRFEKEFEENSSRSFWFVLKECSAVLDVSPLCLYRLVNDIEQQMLKLLPKKRRKGNEPKKKERPRLCEPRLHEYPKKKPGRHRKNMDKNLSGENSLHWRPERFRKDFKNASASQSQHRPRKLGRPRKTLDANLSETSDSQEWRLETLSEDSEDSSTSEDHDQPRKRGRPHKTLDEIFSENSDLQRERCSKHIKESSSSKNQDKLRKRGRPRKTLDDSSEDSDSQGWRSKKYRNNLEHVQNQEQPRKRGRPRKTLGKIISEDSDSDSQDLKPRRSSNDFEDASTTQNQDQPRKPGKPRKTLDRNLSETSDSKDFSPERLRKDSEDSNQKISQNRSRTRGNPHKPLEENLSDTSNPQDCNSKRLCESSDDSSTLQIRRRKRERLLKPLDESLSDDSDSQHWRLERLGKASEDINTSQNQDQPRKQGRTLKSLDESLPKDSHSEKWRPERSSKDLEESCTSQNKDQPRKQERSLNSLDESLSEDSDSPKRKPEIPNTLDSRLQEDDSILQNQELPSKRGRPPKYVDEYPPEVWSFQRSTPERSSTCLVSSHIEGESTCLDSTHIDDESASQNREQPRKRGRSRKYLDGKAPGGNLKNPDQTRKGGRPRKYMLGKPPGEKSQNSNIQDERASQNQEHPRKRGRNTPKDQEHPKKRVRLRPRKSLDGNVSEDSDSDKSTPERSRTYSDSSLQENESTSQKQEYQRKRERNLPQNQEHTKKRGRPPKSLDEDHPEASASQWTTDSSLKDGSLMQNPEHPRKRPRKYVNRNSRKESMSQKRIVERLSTHSDSSCEEDESVLQNQDQLKKRGSPRKYVDDNSPEESASQRSTPEKSSIYLDSSHHGDKSPSRNQEPPRKRRRPFKSIDGSVLELSASNKGSPERCSKFDWSLQDQSTSRPHKYVAGNTPNGNTSKRSTPERSSTYLSSSVSGSRGENTLQNRIPEIASTDMNSSFQEDNDVSNNQEQPRKRIRPSKSMDGSLLEASASQKTTQSRSSIYLKVVSRSQKEKYPGTKSVEVTLSEVMNILQERRPERLKPSKYVEDASDSQNKAHPNKQGKPCKSMDFPKISILHRKPERPSVCLNRRPLGNASTPQNQGLPNKLERFSKYVDRSLPDISAIQDSTADASFLRNRTEEYSETKVIGFDQF